MKRFFELGQDIVRLICDFSCLSCSFPFTVDYSFDLFSLVLVFNYFYSAL